MTVSGADAGGPVRLTATLTGADGRPLGKEEIRFRQASDVFGAKAPYVPIGTAVTDGKGVASITYKSTVAGQQRFAAAYAGDARAGAATAATVVTVRTAYPAYAAAPPKGLEHVGSVTVDVLLAVVAAVWLTLVAQVVRVRRACRAPAAAARG